MDKERLLKSINDIVKEQAITAYEIGKDTGLNTANVQKILNGKIKNPHKKTLITLSAYLKLKLENIEPSTERRIVLAVCDELYPILQNIYEELLIIRNKI